MMKFVRVSVAALAFTGLVAQPLVAEACVPPPCPSPASAAGPAIGVFWAVSFFLCAGMAVGQQDEWAKRHHTTVSGRDRADGLISCIIPPIGFHRLKHKA